MKSHSVSTNYLACRLTPILVVCSSAGMSSVCRAQLNGAVKSTDPVPVQSPATAIPAPATNAIPAAPAPILIPELMIAGHTVMRLRATAGGLSPDERTFDLRRRLGTILTLPALTANDVTVVQDRPRKSAAIYVRSRLLITVDRNLARANNTSISDLAEQWANNLKTALPQVNISVRMFDISTGN